MFIHRVPLSRYSADVRYSFIDRTNKTGNRILRLCRRITATEYEKRDATRDRARLDALFATLPMNNLNVLAVMYMIDTRWSGATGEGAVWAAASEVCNLAALAELRYRPTFVIE